MEYKGGEIGEVDESKELVFGGGWQKKSWAEGLAREQGLREPGKG